MILTTESFQVVITRMEPGDAPSTVEIEVSLDVASREGGGEARPTQGVHDSHERFPAWTPDGESVGFAVNHAVNFDREFRPQCQGLRQLGNLFLFWRRQIGTTILEGNELKLIRLHTDEFAAIGGVVMALGSR